MVHVNLGEAFERCSKIVGFYGGQVIPIQSLTTGVRLELWDFSNQKKIEDSIAFTYTPVI